MHINCNRSVIFYITVISCYLKRNLMQKHCYFYTGETVTLNYIVRYFELYKETWRYLTRPRWAHDRGSNLFFPKLASALFYYKSTNWYYRTLHYLNVILTCIERPATLRRPPIGSVPWAATPFVRCLRWMIWAECFTAKRK